MGNKSSSGKDKNTNRKNEDIGSKNKAFKCSLKQIDLFKSIRSTDTSIDQARNNDGKEQKATCFDKSGSDSRKVDFSNTNAKSKDVTVQWVENVPDRNLFKQTYLLKNLVHSHYNHYYPELGLNLLRDTMLKLHEEGVKISEELVVRLYLVGLMKTGSRWVVEKMELTNAELTISALSKILEEQATEYDVTLSAKPFHIHEF